MGSQARNGSTRGVVTSFAAWCEQMQDTESLLSEDERLALGVNWVRPRCPTHDIAMDGPRTVSKGQEQNRGRSYYCCKHSEYGPQNPCGNRENSENEGAHAGYSLGFLWADGTEPNGTVAKERATEFYSQKRKRDEAEEAGPAIPFPSI